LSYVSTQEYLRTAREVFREARAVGISQVVLKLPNASHGAFHITRQCTRNKFFFIPFMK